MPVIYEIYCGGDIAGDKAFSSKEQAVKAARALLANYPDFGPVEIEKVVIPSPSLKTVLDIINAEGGSYSLARETVQTIKRGNRGAIKPAKSASPEKPPEWMLRNLRDANANSTLIEIINGHREIRRYPTADGRVIYAVGGVGFYHLDEARIYAKGVNE